MNRNETIQFNLITHSNWFLFQVNIPISSGIKECMTQNSPNSFSTKKRLWSPYCLVAHKAFSNYWKKLKWTQWIQEGGSTKKARWSFSLVKKSFFSLAGYNMWGGIPILFGMPIFGSYGMKMETCVTGVGYFGERLIKRHLTAF